VQLREDYDRFTAAGASVIAVAPHDVKTVAAFTAKEPMPFPVLADPEHTVFDLYDVASRALSLGQRPAVFVIGADGRVRFDAVGTQQWQIPGNDEVLGVLANG